MRGLNAKALGRVMGSSVTRVSAAVLRPFAIEAASPWYDQGSPALCASFARTGASDAHLQINNRRNRGEFDSLAEFSEGSIEQGKGAPTACVTTYGVKPHLLSPVKRRIRAVTWRIRHDDAYVRNFSFDSALL